MSNGTNQSKSMADVRKETREAIDYAEGHRQRLDLIRMDLQLYGGNSPETAEALSKVLDAHHMLCVHLRNLYQLMMATEPAPSVVTPEPPAPQPKTDAQLHPRSDLPRGEFLGHLPGTDR
jgi:hypothetical protein